MAFFRLQPGPLFLIFNHMVKHTTQTLDRVFAALADPTRRAILDRLAHSDASVSELAAPFAMSLPAISKHLRVLEQAGLIARTKDGRVHRLRLVAQPMKDAAAWMGTYQRFWEGQLDALADYLQALDHTDTQEEQTA
jgi:DNA-binding transcriptional ArsR family regulator